jgi:transposase
MLLQTILNRVHTIRGFDCGSITFSTWGGVPALEVKVHPRKSSQGICSQCGGKGPSYDTQHNLRMVRSYLLKEEFQLFWGYRSVLLRPVSGIRLNPVSCGTLLPTG